MTNNNPIETWTREQCEEYLNQYPKSLKSEAVRKRLENLTPKPEPELKPKSKPNPEHSKPKESSAIGSKGEKHGKDGGESMPKQSPETERESRMNAIKAKRESRLKTLRFLKYAGIIICIIAAIALVLVAINTGTEITITFVLALLYPIYLLSKWDID